MLIYKIKEQIMKNLLFTFPNRIFTEHLYITDIYRYKQYIANIKILRILLTITTTAMMLVMNNNNDNIDNNNNYNKKKKKVKEKKKAQNTVTHTDMLKTSPEFSSFNVYFLDILRNLFELCLL